jgi:hypothetical protein
VLGLPFVLPLAAVEPVPTQALPVMEGVDRRT